MKKQFFVSVFVLVLYNILILYICPVKYDLTYPLTILISVTGSGIIATFLFNWLIKPFAELKNQLEEAESIRREFVANVTHELKTPLTSITGFIETLQSGAQEDPEIRSKFIDIIAIETARLTRLIEDLLVISDIENKRSMDLDHTFDVKASLESIIDTMIPIADSRGISLEADLENNLLITGSEDRFKQMMVNLIDNAIKYSGNGKIVTIKAKKTIEGIEVSVQDHGIGVKEEDIPRLFERFFRVDKSRSQKMGGTGLGLSIVKHTAALFDAALNVESDLGKGSTFYVVFRK